MKNTFLITITFFIFIFSTAYQTEAEALETKVNDLTNLPTYVDWPKQAFDSTFADFVFGVVGDEDFAKKLDDIEKGKWLDGHPVSIHHFKTFSTDRVKALKGCHILFISSSQKENLDVVLQSLVGKPILIVSDMEHFADQGGMVEFDLRGDKVNLLINPESARKAHLHISSRLLQISTIVKSNNKKPKSFPAFLDKNP